MLIEEMKKKHIKDVCLIEKECFSDPWSENMIAEELKNERSTYRIITDCGMVVAYMGMYEVCGEGNITNVAVHPAYRRRGYAKALIEYFVAFAKNHDYEFLTLEVRKSNAAAIKLYESFGFVKVGERKNYYEGKENALLMTKFF